MRSAFRTAGVSLVELLIALVVLGIVAALTLPRFGRAAGAPDESALLRERLRVLRVAIERYSQDHDALPAQYGDGDHAAGTEAALVAQLTGFTDETGRVSDVRDARYRFGPYLRDGMPACPVPPRGGLGGVHVQHGVQVPEFAPDETGAGWVYNCETGQIAPNSDQTDGTGQTYVRY